MIKKTFLLLTLLIFLCLFTAESENIRGPIDGIVEFDGYSTQSVTSKIESLVGIKLPETLSPLVQGLRITISGPDKLKLYRNSFSLYLYKELDQEPSADNMSYQGTQAYMRFMDFEKSMNFLIPLSRNHTMSPDRSSFIVMENNNPEDFPLLLTILPITKGIPDSVYTAEINLSISPVFFNKGTMSLKILDNEGNPVDETLYYQVDGKMINDLSKPVIFDAGFHTLIIRSDSGLEESLQFSLSPGENLTLNHILQLQYPTLKIDTVKGMAVFLDGKRIENEEMDDYIEIQPGSHSIRFEFGDYQLSREFNAEMQDSFRITMIPEILLEKLH